MMGSWVLQCARVAFRRAASIPWVYDLAQFVFGLKETRRRLRPHLSQTRDRLVIDVGGGTGILIDALPDSVSYILIDNDPAKIKRFREKRPHGRAILSDATRICLKDKSVDYALCVALAHHLSDKELPLLFQEMARMVRQEMVFLDPVQNNGSRIGRLLWACDQGNYPRSANAICEAIRPWFEIEHSEQYAIYHHYVLILGRPR